MFQSIIPPAIRHPTRIIKKAINFDFNYYLKYEKFQKTKIFGNTMYLTKPSLVSREIVRFGVHEKGITDYVFSTIKKGDFVVDLGANIGYYTLIFAKLVGQEGQVVSFEPEISNFKILQKNIRKNHYNNTKIENSAVSNKNEKTKLYLSKMGTGTHRLFEAPIIDNGVTQIVNVTTLDDYLKNNGMMQNISLIKMDIEGSEFNALQGMETILKTSKELKIIMEYAPFALKEAQTDPKELIDYLDSFGFSFKYFEKNSLTPKDTNRDYLKTRAEGDTGVWGNADVIDLVCTKNTFQ